ncbi:hypothetical protein J5226_08655 [Lysobacter sp. K5869]|uniref:hypothetical protein n=1 Tax=Lysobacter sp. K5869 TaxID=2820808 RepID=UPI001C063378|nr:hypothetical protein [Lysobacter sp. K5869]QWP78445.1 hypothetical protein J5226_08655 [Lysobacter sp. K5869]
MTALTRWLAPVALAAGLGAAAVALPAPARADDLTRVIVDIADVIVRNNTPYWRYGNYGYDDRLVVVRDRWGRPTYYRNVPRYADYRYRPAPRYYANDRRYYDRDCNRSGRCRTTYYDARYDRRYDNRWDNRWDNRHYDRGRHNGHWRGRGDRDDD